MTKKIVLVAGFVALVGVTGWASRVDALPDNPHYCCWQAKGIKDKFAGTFADQTASGSFEKCKFKAICNPCDKNLSGTPPDEDLHYCLWQCKGPKLKVLYDVTDDNFIGGLIETKKLKFILNQCEKGIP